MTSWVLVLTMYAFDAKTQMHSNTQVIEYKGFSSKSDCEIAGEAVGDMFLQRDGQQNGLSKDCKKAR